MENQSCGTCLWYCDGRCWFNHSWGDVPAHKENDPACKYWDEPNPWFDKKQVVHLVNTFDELNEKYGYNPQCKNCYWYCEYHNDPGRGLCSRTRWYLEVSEKCYACGCFEVDHD